ncbi:hypothetical protein [Streptomyces sp. NPDC059010]|uniref:hypothetical protein n=1 Tax=Streptomyces sp. NPDC059010 TaxID=3346695 RepID=UPI0036D0C341
MPAEVYGEEPTGRSATGAPMVALLIDVALCACLLGARRGRDRTHIANVMGSTTVTLITTAGILTPAAPARRPRWVSSASA